MLQRATRWRLLAIAGGLALLFIYLYGLDRMGLFSADEPRYASIGRRMAQSDDYITPRLWGEGWFEKPPMLYWLIAGGFRLGLSNDLAPRVPVALLSVGFLIAFFWMLRREFGIVPAAYSTTILATTGGWIALSEIGVTDIPMATMFGLALLFTLPWLRTGDRRWLNAAAVALGFAFLAKSTPPLFLYLPVAWFGRGRWRDLLRPAPWLLFLLIAAPWHVICALRNGPIFMRTLFWQQQIERFISPSLQHVQPWWFYVKLLPATFFPWTPMVALLFRRDLYSDRRLQFLMATAIWVLVFFSASTNKLPTYLLPMLPPFAIVAGVALDRAQLAGRVVIALSALLCFAFPVVITKLPSMMSRNPQAASPGMPMALAVGALLVLAAVCFIRNRAISIALAALLAGAGYVWIKAEAFPYLDAAATARPVAHRILVAGLPVCVKRDVPRDWRYGLNYYTEAPLPDCDRVTDRRWFVDFRDHELIAELPGDSARVEVK
jgi:4-amino-4-deoxy-L-arabinose transferase-like glycosyltransferase